MTDRDILIDINILLNVSASTTERLNAIHHVVNQNSEIVVGSLLQIAQSEDNKEVSYATGWAIAEILLRKGVVLEVPLAQFNGEAYLGFDEAVTYHSKRTSS